MLKFLMRAMQNPKGATLIMSNWSFTIY